MGGTRQQLRISRKHAGFTLLETLITIVVAAILLGVLLPTLLGSRNNSHVQLTVQNIKSAIASAQSAFSGYGPDVPTDASIIFSDINTAGDGQTVQLMATAPSGATPGSNVAQYVGQPVSAANQVSVDVMAGAPLVTFAGYTGMNGSTTACVDAVWVGEITNGGLVQDKLGVSGLGIWWTETAPINGQCTAIDPTQPPATAYNWSSSAPTQ